MARASTVTLLSLDRFARIMSLNPAHFNQGVGAAVMVAGGGCQDVIHQYQWQANDRVSREDLALAIANAEEDIANIVGFYPGPKCINDEIHRYPQPYRPEWFGDGTNIRGMGKSIKADRGKVITPGVCASSLIAVCTHGIGGTLDYIDTDADGYLDTARIVQPTAVTDIRELHVFFHGYLGDPAWEIRPPKAISITAGIATIDFWAWQLFLPSLWEALTTATPAGAIDLADNAAYVTSVDLYREYIDTTQPSARFYWEPGPGLPFDCSCSACGGTGCPVCGLTTQTGCLHIRDVIHGLVVPEPATYDEQGAAWAAASWTECREPDQVKIYYQAGDLDQAYRAGTAWDPLSTWWAETIAWLATARLERDICSCSAGSKMFAELRANTSRIDQQGPNWDITDDDKGNPLGPHWGEIKAWRRIKKVYPRRIKVAVV